MSQILGGCVNLDFNNINDTGNRDLYNYLHKVSLTKPIYVSNVDLVYAKASAHANVTRETAKVTLSAIFRKEAKKVDVVSLVFTPDGKMTKDVITITIA